MLAGASKPIVVTGDGIAFSGAQAELTRVAELLGAEVWGANFSEVNIAADHPLFRGQLGHMFGDHSRAITSEADAVLICGTYVFPEVFPALEGVFAPGAKVVHVELDAYEIAKNFPVDAGIVADPKLTLGLFADELERTLTTDQREAAARRTGDLADRKRKELAAWEERDAAFEGDSPMHPSVFMAELAKQAPEDVVIFDEALTASPELTHHLPPTLPGHYFCTRGGSLGVGFPGALGVKLAMPDKTVIGFSGDGGAPRDRREVRRLQQPQLPAAQAQRAAVLEGARLRRPLLPGLVRPRQPRDPLRPAGREHGRAGRTGGDARRGRTRDRAGARRRRPVPDRPAAAPGSARPRRGRGQPPPGRRDEGSLMRARRTS
jgi:thiamine pyrophosphate-dependent acetolactate synthase large subunit-like protein